MLEELIFTAGANRSFRFEGTGSLLTSCIVSAGNLLNIMLQRPANENAAFLRRICKRFDQPKIERLVNNDARLILRGKLN